jgi:hypothetical protein
MYSLLAEIIEKVHTNTLLLTEGVPHSYGRVRKEIATAWPESGTDKLGYTFKSQRKYTEEDLERYKTKRTVNILKDFENIFNPPKSPESSEQNIQTAVESFSLYSSAKKYATTESLVGWANKKLLDFKDNPKLTQNQLLGAIGIIKFLEENAYSALDDLLSYFKNNNDKEALRKVYENLYDLQPWDSSSGKYNWPSLTPVPHKGGGAGRPVGSTAFLKSLGLSEEMRAHINNYCCVAYNVDKSNNVKVDPVRSQKKFIKYFQSNVDFRILIRKLFWNHQALYSRLLNFEEPGDSFAFIERVLDNQKNDNVVKSLYTTLVILQGTGVSDDSTTRAFPVFSTTDMKKKYQLSLGGVISDTGKKKGRPIKVRGELQDIPYTDDEDELQDVYYTDDETDTPTDKELPLFTYKDLKDSIDTVNTYQNVFDINIRNKIQNESGIALLESIIENLGSFNTIVDDFIKKSTNQYSDFTTNLKSQYDFLPDVIKPGIPGFEQVFEYLKNLIQNLQKKNHTPFETTFLNILNMSVGGILRLWAELSKDQSKYSKKGTATSSSPSPKAAPVPASPTLVQPETIRPAFSATELEKANGVVKKIIDFQDQRSKEADSRVQRILINQTIDANEDYLKAILALESFYNTKIEEYDNAAGLYELALSKNDQRRIDPETNTPLKGINLMVIILIHHLEVLTKAVKSSFEEEQPLIKSMKSAVEKVLKSFSNLNKKDTSDEEFD